MRNFIITVLLLCLAFPATAKTPGAKTILQYVPQAERVGQGRLTYLLWDVYDAALYAPKGKMQAGGGYALSLSYLTALDNDDIVQASCDEMLRMGNANAQNIKEWRSQLLAIFPDIKPGDNITGIHTSKGQSVFLLNGKKIGQINDPQFSKAFFAIWFDPDTKAANLRRKLLGQWQQ